MEFESTPIFFSTNSNYLYATKVAIYSLLDHREGEFLNIHVLGVDLSESQLQQLETIASEYENCTIRAKNIDITPLQNALCSYLTVAANVRLLIPSLFPQYKCGLWVDSDVLVTGSLRELLSIDLGDNYLAAVRECEVFQVRDPESYGPARRIHMPDPEEYFTSGVMLLNLEKMRADKIQEKAIEILETKKRSDGFKCPDQDALNLVTCGHTLTLDPCWNWLTNSFFPAQRRVVIWHYFSRYKPWQMVFSSGKNHSGYRLYMDYQRKLAKRHPIEKRWKICLVNWRKNLFGVRDLFRAVRLGLKRLFFWRP